MVTRSHGKLTNRSVFCCQLQPYFNPILCSYSPNVSAEKPCRDTCAGANRWSSSTETSEVRCRPNKHQIRKVCGGFSKPLLPTRYKIATKCYKIGSIGILPSQAVIKCVLTLENKCWRLLCTALRFSKTYFRLLSFQGRVIYVLYRHSLRTAYLSGHALREAKRRPESVCYFLQWRADLGRLRFSF